MLPSSHWGVCVSLFGCMHSSAGIPGSQKHWVFLRLNWPIWPSLILLGSSVKAVLPLNLWATFLAPVKVASMLCNQYFKRSEFCLNNLFSWKIYDKTQAEDPVGNFDAPNTKSYFRSYYKMTFTIKQNKTKQPFTSSMSVFQHMNISPVIGGQLSSARLYIWVETTSS